MGGPLVISSELQVIVNVVDFGMNLRDAIDFPRIHHQWKPDLLGIERGVSPDTLAVLKQMGYTLFDLEQLPLGHGNVQAILINNGWLQGCSDAKGMGKAAGY